MFIAIMNHYEELDEDRRRDYGLHEVHADTYHELLDKVVMIMIANQAELDRRTVLVHSAVMSGMRTEIIFVGEVMTEFDPDDVEDALFDHFSFKEYEATPIARQAQEIVMENIEIDEE